MEINIQTLKTLRKEMNNQSLNLKIVSVKFYLNHIVVIWIKSWKFFNNSTKSFQFV